MHGPNFNSRKRKKSDRVYCVFVLASHATQGLVALKIGRGTSFLYSGVQRPSSAAEKVSVVCGTNNHMKSEMLS